MIDRSIEELFIRLRGDASEFSSMMNKASFQTETTLSKIQRTTVIAGAAIAGVMTLVSTVATREYAKFDKAVTDSLATMSGVNADMRKDMEKTARSIARNTIHSASGVAEGYKAMADAGYDSVNALAMLPSITNFATAGFMEVNAASQNLVDTMALLNMRTEDSTQNLANLQHISRLIIQSSKLGGQTAAQMLTALQTKGAGQGGLTDRSLERSLALLVAYGRAGAKGAEGAERMVQVERDLMTTFEKNREVYDFFNLDIYEEGTRKLRDHADILSDINFLLKDMNVEQRKAALTEMGFQDRAVQSLIMGFPRADEIRGLEENFKKVGDVVTEIAEYRLTSFNSQLTITMNKITDMAIGMGERLAPSLIQLNAWLTKVFTEGSAEASNFEAAMDDMTTTVIQGISVAAAAIYGLIKGMQDLMDQARMTGLAISKWMSTGKTGRYADQKTIDFEKSLKKDMAEYTRLSHLLKMQQAGLKSYHGQRLEGRDIEGELARFQPLIERGGANAGQPIRNRNFGDRQLFGTRETSDLALQARLAREHHQQWSTVGADAAISGPAGAIQSRMDSRQNFADEIYRVLDKLRQERTPVARPETSRNPPPTNIPPGAPSSVTPGDFALFERRQEERLKVSKAWDSYENQIKSNEDDRWQVSRPDFSRTGIGTEASDRMMKVEEKQLAVATQIRDVLIQIKEAGLAPPGRTLSEILGGEASAYAD